MTMFTKYVKDSKDTKVLLMHLLLGGYDLKKIKHLEKVEENRMFGLKVMKIYGVTEEFVDIRKIEEEIESIQTPIICSPMSYEYYSDSPVIQCYKPQVGSKPLIINDMGIISKVMMITKDYVISNNEAKPLTDTDDCGFTYFMDYVLKGETVIGKWRITYHENTFNVFYLSENEDKNTDEDTKAEELLYSAIEIDKTSTYKMVIYIIRKVAVKIDTWEADNFTKEPYRLIV